jgi:hypothetical protein
VTVVALLLVPEDAVSPGILGFTLVFALGLALYFLIRSMNKHISRIKAPREDDLKQAEWERRQEESKRSATGDDKGEPDDGDAPGGTAR